MKLLLLRQHKSRAVMGMGHRGGDKGHLASHIPSQGDVAAPTAALSGGGKWELLDPGALGCAGGHGRSSPPSPPAPGAPNPPEGLQPLTKRGINHLIKPPQLKRCRH